jgi:hypothetical protein
MGWFREAGDNPCAELALAENAARASSTIGRNGKLIRVNFLVQCKLSSLSGAVYTAQQYHTSGVWTIVTDCIFDHLAISLMLAQLPQLTMGQLKRFQSISSVVVMCWQSRIEGLISYLKAWSCASVARQPR